ncbi:MAG: TIGR03086 family metal-binding protein [Acidimicrobiia bacterium]
MTELELLQRVVDETTRVVANVDDSQLANPSPCEGWTVRDVVNHIVGGSTIFAMSVEETTADAATMDRLFNGDNVGADPLGAWTASSERALAAFRLPGALEKSVTLPFGEMPGSVALSIAIFDVLTHAVDIASATGQHVDDVELLETALVMGEQMVTPELRVPGVFDPAQPVAAEAPAETRLLAFAGRRV